MSTPQPRDILLCESSSSSLSSLSKNQKLNRTDRNYHNGRNNLDDFIYELKRRNEEEEEDGSQQNDQMIMHSHHSSTREEMRNHHHTTSSSSRSMIETEMMDQDDGAYFTGQRNQDPEDLLESSHSTDALLSRLAKKEKDLILAAELGKALLDRNEELSRANEQLNEEYTRNIELLEQEKYVLRKKLGTIEIEYENKIHDLQADLQAVREKLQTHLEIGRQNETENGRIIAELTEQNQRLTTELKESSSRESALEKEVQSLREQYTARRTNFTDHIGQLEGLRDEINLLSHRKRELECKISSLSEEKASISLSLEESQFKILSLEKQLYENELQLQNQQKELDDVRRLNIQYQNKIDTLNKTRQFDGTGAHHPAVSSLYNEIEISSHTSSCDDNATGTTTHGNGPNFFGPEIEEMDPFVQYSNFCHHCYKSKQEMLDLYNKLRQLFDDLCKRQINPPERRRRNSSEQNGGGGGDATAASVSSSSVAANNSHDSGIQANLSLIDEMNMLVCDIQDLLKNLDFMCLTCQQFSIERNELDRLNRKASRDKTELQRLGNEVIKLSSDAAIRQAELVACRERVTVLEKDLADMAPDSGAGTDPDEIVKRALKMRDETIARKNAAEIELAKVRIELMHVNSQLLETIQQKVELSQQLEQWQVDMEILIEEQLKNKLSMQERTSSSSSSSSSAMATAINNGTGNSSKNLFGRISFAKFLNYNGNANNNQRSST